VIDFIEAIVAMLPQDAGGRSGIVAPREGSYRPFARAGGEQLRIRFIEGPPQLAPGCDELVMIEVETPADESLLAPGAELEVVEHDRLVGLLTVTRRFAMVAVLLFAGCASSATSDRGTYVNQPGDPIEITLEGSSPRTEEIDVSQAISFVVVIANNSDLDVTVTQVNVFQGSVGALVVQPVTSAQNVLIDPGKEAKVDVLLRTMRATEKSAMSVSAPIIALRVVVTLANGDRYMQAFEIPIRGR
jgi:hypothetical protein